MIIEKKMIGQQKKDEEPMVSDEILLENETNTQITWKTSMQVIILLIKCLLTILHF